MDRQTLAHYGWIVIVALVLAVMLALATPFGKYVMDGVSSIASGYINASNEAMSDENKDKLVAEWEDKWLNSTSQPDSKLNHTHVATGAIYTADDGTVYNEGEMLPTPQKGDIYSFNDYEYCFGYEYLTSENSWSHKANNPYECEGWSVRYMGDDTKPGEILESIGGEYITNMAETFYETYIIVAPKIPSHVTSIVAAFSGCPEMGTAPYIPSSVKDMSYAFQYCYALCGDVKIDASPTSFGSCFSYTGIDSISGNCPDNIKQQLLNTASEY